MSKYVSYDASILPFCATRIDVVECPLDCAAHLELYDRDGDIGAIATLSVVQIQLLLTKLAEMLDKRLEVEKCQLN